MIDFEFSEHAENMRKERDVLLSWVRLTLEDPVETEQKDDGTVHYIRLIEEREGSIFFFFLAGGGESRCYSLENSDPLLRP